jgi:hypothetical protein
MTLITIPELPISNIIPLNSLIPFENLQNNETQATTLSTILSNVIPSTKLYINNVLSGTHPALNLIAGTNISFTDSSTSNYKSITINSTIPTPLSIASVGGGASLYKNFTSTYNFKSLVAGSNVTITPNTDTITIGVTAIGEANTASNTGTGVGLFKSKVGLDLQFKSLVAGTGISFDTSNNNQIVINSTGSSSSATGQNVGIGTGRFYINNVSSVLRFKSLRAGSNILISDGASEITISAIGGGEGGSSITNTSGAGSRILNTSGQLKTLIAGNGLIFVDTEQSLTLSTNVANGMANVGTGIPLYKGFNSLLDRYELKTIKGQDGLTVTSLNDNEIVIGGNSNSSIASTSITNTLVSSQVGALTTLKVINSGDITVATITNNTDNLTLNILNNSNKWNANKINSIPITFPVTPSLPEQESTLVYRGNEYVTGTPTNLISKYLTGQRFGATIPANNQVFKVSDNNQWALALPTDSTSPSVNFLGFYLGSRIYPSGSIVEGLTGLVAGTIYYLNNSSTFSVTPSAIILGIALNTTTLWFKPYAA